MIICYNKFGTWFKCYSKYIWPVICRNRIRRCMDIRYDIKNKYIPYLWCLVNRSGVDYPSFTFVNEMKMLVEVWNIQDILTLSVRGPSYLGLTRSIAWLLMPWLLMSPGHQQPWYWLCRIGRFLSYLRKDFNYLHRINVGKWHKM